MSGHTYTHTPGPAQAVRLVRFWPDQYFSKKGSRAQYKYRRVRRAGGVAIRLGVAVRQSALLHNKCT